MGPKDRGAREAAEAVTGNRFAISKRYRGSRNSYRDPNLNPSTQPGGFFFCFKAMLFGQTGKSGRPPSLQPALKFHWDFAHNLTPGLEQGAHGTLLLRTALPMVESERSSGRDGERQHA
jgi:hypothetical protein